MNDLNPRAECVLSIEGPGLTLAVDQVREESEGPVSKEGLQLIPDFAPWANAESHAL